MTRPANDRGATDSEASTSPVVSVCILAYNHEPFIAQALDSALMQETEFDYEIVLGEDESQDATREICIKYARHHPDRIRLFLRSRKNVIYVNGRPTGRFNTVENQKAARGKYIALLDGDDYWTDPHKLQMQVDYLEAHPECSICFHGYETRYEDASRPPHLSPPPPGDITSLEDLLVWDYIGNVTVMFRRRQALELPGWYYELEIGDWPLHILNAQYGNIGYIDSVMAVYRIHGGGTWQRWSRVQRLKNDLELFRHLRSHLDARYQKTISASVAWRYLALAAAYANDGDIRQGRVSLRKCIAEGPINEQVRLLTLFSLTLRLYAPRLHKVLEGLLRPSTGRA